MARCMSGLFRIAVVLSLCLAAPRTASAATIWATSVISSTNSLVPGEDFLAFYGGTFPGVFPVAFGSVAAAEAAVLGAPDTVFLTLPGTSTTDFFANIPASDSVWLEFGTTFGAGTLLHIVELGDSLESAWVLVINPAVTFGYAFLVTRGASDDIVIDLGDYPFLWSFIGGTAGSVRIFGADLLGASRGFDLDAVGIESTPEPATLLLLGSGLAVAAAARRRMRKPRA